MLDKTRKPLFPQLVTKNMFLRKNWTFFFRKMSHTVKNVNGGTFWNLLTYILLQNIKKLERGTLWRQTKLKKVAQRRKKLKGDPLATSGFVGYVKKIKNERGTLRTTVPNEIVTIDF